MVLRKWVVSILFMLPLVFAQSGWAQTPGQGAVSAPPMEMEEGDAPRMTFSGYGELHYNIPSSFDTDGDGIDDAQNSKMDFHRLVLGWNYEFSDRITLYTEVEFEHAGQEMELEFAFLDFFIDPAFNVRAGALLMPVGPLNEYHEPPLFYSVERPYFQKFIIPTTWQEGGIGIFGSPLPGLNYRVYLVSGLASSGFSGKNGLRKGRGKVAGGEKKPQTGEELAFVGRLEYSPMAGFDLGLSLYEGNSDQANDAGADGGVSIVEVDGRVRMSGLDFRAVYAKIEIDDADQINIAHTDPGPPVIPGDVAEEITGWYVELAYRLGQTMGTDWDLVPFVRVEEINTHDKVPAGTTLNPAFNRNVTTYGIAYYPHPQVVFKADYENWEDDSTGPDWEQFNLGMAFMF